MKAHTKYNGQRVVLRRNAVIHGRQRRFLLGAIHAAEVPDLQQRKGTEASKCPVLRSLAEVPEHKYRGLLDTYDVFLTDPFKFQSKMMQGQPMVKSYGRRGSTLIIGDAALTKQVLANDLMFMPDYPSKPELGDEGVLFLSGEEHSRVRGVMVPAFAPEEIEKYTPQVQDLAVKYFDQVVDQCRASSLTPVHFFTRQFTFEIICTIVGGLQLSELQLQAMLQDYHLLEGTMIGGILPVPKSIFNLPFMPGGKGLAARQRIVDRLQSGIDAARARLREGQSQQGQGLLQEMVALGAGLDRNQQEQEHSRRTQQGRSRGQASREEVSEKQAPSHHQLTDKQLCDNMLLFLLAGFDTTSALITSMMYNMWLYPHTWRVVEAEQERIVAQHGQRITPQLMRQMPATENFVRETLRMRPPLVQLLREAACDAEVGGYKVPAGWKLYQPLSYINMTDPVWQGEREGGELDPMVFNPSRFEGVKGRGQQMAFGYGKHVCLGQPLAMMEAKVALAVLARGYEVKELEEPKQWLNIPVVKPTNNLPVVMTRKEQH